MIIQTEHLGKVSVTVEKDYHNINKCYDKLTIVEEENEFRTYISRKPVPNGIELTNRNYWIPFSSLERQIVIDYNKFKNDVLFASAFHEKLDPTLPEGVAIIKQLFDKDNNLIIPKVSEEAVSDETGKTLKAKLAELTTTLSNTIDTYLNTYFADTIEKAEDIVNHPTYIGTDNYVYVWNRITKTYDKTSIYTRGEGFHVSKTFASIADMEAYTGTDLKEGDFVLIQSTPDDPDNAKLYTYSGTQGVYNYLVDMSGALGFTGKTPQFSIGSVITVNPDVPASASLSPDGTDVDGNPKYKLNLALPKGAKGTSNFVIVDDHSGAGDDPDKIYIPSAESHKEVYDGLIEDEETIGKALVHLHTSIEDHIYDSDCHVTPVEKEKITTNTESRTLLEKLIFNGHEYFDLKLPSGTLWATKNIGANIFTDAGKHFMWGKADNGSLLETDFVLPSPYTADGENYVDKYKKVISNDSNYDIKQYLDITDDVAHKHWGGAWRVPTKEQWEELFTNTYHWQTTINGVKVIGFRPTGSSSSPNASLYIPFVPIFGSNETIAEGAYYHIADILGTDDATCINIANNNTQSIKVWWGLCIRPVICL